MSRMTGPRQYAGMVEWLQKAPPRPQRDPSSFFRINLDGTKFSMLYSPRDPINPIMRFLALQFARSIFPESLAAMGELRVSYGDGGGRLISALYSGTPPLGQACCHEARDTAGANHGEGDDAFLFEFGQRSLELSGILLSSTASFCDMCDKRLVLFEISGIRLRDAFMAVAEYSSEPEDSLALLSLIYSVMLRDYTKKNPPFMSQYRGYQERGFEEIANAVFMALLASAPGPLESEPRPLSDGTSMFCGFRELLHGTHSRAARAESRDYPDGRKTEWPVSIDPIFL